jgi:TolA-binding protein
MEAKLKNIFISLLISLLLLAFIGCSSGGSQGTDTQALQAQVSLLQTQLAQSQQNVTQLQAQLTQSQQQVTDLQTKLSQQVKVTASSTPVYIKGDELNARGDVWGGGYATVPIELKQNEKVEGEIVKPYLTAIIQDSDGKTVKDLTGTPNPTQFSFTAKTTGRYLIVLNSTNNNMSTAYSIKYWIYSIN